MFQLHWTRMAGCSGSDLDAMVLEDKTVCGPCESTELIVPKIDCIASLRQSSSVPHLPIHPSHVPYQPMALAYPALQLFYLLPGAQGSPPVLLPVVSSLPHRQPLFLPPLTCGAAQQTNLEVTTSLQSEGRIAKVESCVGSKARFANLKGEFFRPWENACSGALSKQSLTECQKFRPWEEAFSSTQLHKGIEEDNCVTNMMKGMVIGQQMVE